MLVNVAVAAAFLVHKRKRNTLLLAAVTAAAVLQAGRLVDAPAIPADRSALLVQQNVPVDENWTRDTFQSTLHDLIDLSVKSDSSRYVIFFNTNHRYARGYRQAGSDRVAGIPCPIFYQRSSFSQSGQRNGTRNTQLDRDWSRRQQAANGQWRYFPGFQLRRIDRPHGAMDIAL